MSESEMNQEIVVKAASVVPVASESAEADAMVAAVALLREAKSNAYQSRIDYKKVRFAELADSNSEKASRLYSTARKMASLIPFGQPIHPEPWRGDRSFRDRIHNTYGASFKTQEKSEYYADKAVTVGSGGISSNDGEAILKLESELKQIQEKHNLHKSLNKEIKNLLKSNSLNFDNLKAALPNVGDDVIHTYAKPDSWGKYGIPHYSLAYNNANMRRIKQRIEILTKKENREAAIIAETGKTYLDQAYGAVKLRENFEENRIQIIFPAKVSDESYKILRRHGFVFSRSNKAFQRQLNNAGRYKAKQVLKILEPIEPKFFESIAD